MGNIRRFNLRCSKCYKKYSRHYEQQRIEGKYIARSWENVRLKKALQTGGLFICGNCGHEWKSNADAARRMIAAKQLAERIA